jgi:UDP-sugar pyrophosphorylase
MSLSTQSNLYFKIIHSFLLLMLYYNTKCIVVSMCVNRYTDTTRTTFKKPTRLECMMQDYAKVLPDTASVGFTTSSTWIGYAPAKNSIAEGMAKLRGGCDAMTASTAEASMYSAACEMWRKLGCYIEDPVERQFGGIPVKLGPILSISPHFALTRDELAMKLPRPAEIRVSLKGALVILGSANVIVESLDLDGALVVDTRACEPTVKVVIREVAIKNKGWEFVTLQGDAEEVLRIRGYGLVKHATEKITVPRSLDGSFLISSVRYLKTRVPSAYRFICEHICVA